jgi:hypothetical protein
MISYPLEIQVMVEQEEQHKAKIPQDLKQCLWGVEHLPTRNLMQGFDDILGDADRAAEPKHFSGGCHAGAEALHLDGASQVVVL